MSVTIPKPTIQGTITKTINTVIADDHKIFREGLKYMIGKDQSLHVLGEAQNGFELIEQVKHHQPEVVITDIRMPEMDGLQACKMLKKKYPGMKVIALSMFDEESLVFDMIAAGACGYLLKTAAPEELTTAIKKVAAGEWYFCGEINDKLPSILDRHYHFSRRAKNIQFTLQELRIIRLICKQQTTKEIASQLKLCNRTVEDYPHNIKKTVGARNVIGIALYAMKNKIVSWEEI